MTEPMVSVMMITYNHAPFIAKAIESIIQQKTNYPFELVIGEDCSTDGTIKIILEYEKKYPNNIQLITSEKNVGAAKNALRVGKTCRGKYIAFCDGDDYWHNPLKLQKQVDFMESHPECGLVIADCDVYHNRNKKLQKNVRYSDGYQFPTKLSIEQIIGEEKIRRWPWTCTAMIRRHLYNKIIDQDPFLHQSQKFLMSDTQLFAELSMISEAIYIPECLATYRNLDESASNSLNLRRMLLFWISASEMKLYLCDKHKLSENIRRKAELLWCDKSLQLAFYDRNTSLALEVKKRKQTFTWKEQLRYLGAKYSAIHYSYRAALLLLNLFKKKHDIMYLLPFIICYIQKFMGFSISGV